MVYVKEAEYVKDYQIKVTFSNKNPTDILFFIMFIPRGKRFLDMTLKTNEEGIYRKGVA